MTNPLDWVYDLESYPNIFTADFKHVVTGTRVLFEISDRKSQLPQLIDFLIALKQTGCRLIGFNNIGYDYPVLHFIIENRSYNPTVTDIYNKSKSIIDTPWVSRFDNIIWDDNVHIPQIDLYKVHHFDNDARRTSLKVLEFNMRMPSVEDLPYPPGTFLDDDQKDVLIHYNDHDVDATEQFYIESIPAIEFREKLSEKYSKNFLNHNDTKIGKDYFIMKLEEQLPGSCYANKAPRQTIRSHINLAEVILPYIKFKEPEFERIKNYLASQIITETKGTFKDLTATVKSFKYVFGLGGIHGSIDSTTVYSDDEYLLVDVDVSSYYPNIAIKNDLFPEHLSSEFCKIYEETFNERRKYKKGTPENAALKLALNGVYGDSNNRYSPFYDSKYTMAITINGQLLLCMLAQYLTDIQGLQVIQINTDGITVRCLRTHIDQMNAVCKWWEDYTRLELEHVNYSRMMIRDVNNYIGEYEDGKLKRKGAYEYNREWHQNHSALIVPKAAEAALIHNHDIKDFIINHDDIYDFMLRAKVGRSDKLMYGKQELQRITRYYISITGDTMVKVSPPVKSGKVGQWKRKNGLSGAEYNAVIRELRSQSLNDGELDTTGLPWDERINTKNRSVYKIRETGFDVGWLSTPCNNMRNADRSNINYEYYIAETEKLVKPLRS